jgi:hypothetical protein
MVVHCVLSLPVGDELIRIANSAENDDQGIIDDLVPAEHRNVKHLIITLMFCHIYLQQ